MSQCDYITKDLVRSAWHLPCPPLSQALGPYSQVRLLPAKIWFTALGIQVGSQMGGEGSKQGLIDTIQGLQRALERSRKECEAAVSSAKYMQVTTYILHIHCLPLVQSPHCCIVIAPYNCLHLALEVSLRSHDSFKYVP